VYQLELDSDFRAITGITRTDTTIRIAIPTTDHTGTMVTIDLIIGTAGTVITVIIGIITTIAGNFYLGQY